MRNLDQGMEYLWSKDKFTTRFDYMKELYRHYQLKNNEDDEDDIDFIVPDVSLFCFPQQFLINT